LRLIGVNQENDQKEPPDEPGGTYTCAIGIGYADATQSAVDLSSNPTRRLGEVTILQGGTPVASDNPLPVSDGPAETTLSSMAASEATLAAAVTTGAPAHGAMQVVITGDINLATSGSHVPGQGVLMEGSEGGGGGTAHPVAVDAFGNVQVVDAA